MTRAGMATTDCETRSCCRLIDIVVQRLYACRVKTTFDIDATVVQELREEAARRGITESALAEAGLRHVLVERKPPDEKPAGLPPLPTWRGGGFRADIANREALCRLMEEE